ncbi:holin [Collimonas sp. NPDC087041]|uniref:holin n=1 Tax=Collimonas sp. NPDC087041 TaxID=3363960 RepID=UPI00381B575F
MPEPTSFAAGTWLAVTKFLLPLLPGAVGSAVALKFLGEGLSWWQKLSSFAAGLACAIYIAPVLIEWFAITGSRTHSGIEFLVGLFALATARELFKEINEADIIGALKRRYLGEKNDPAN